jgi:type II secretory pathway pseudopilin PulG
MGHTPKVQVGNGKRARDMSKRASGFSLIELVMIIALIMIGSSIALVQVRQSTALLNADRTSNLVLSQMQYARQIAVDQRRTVTVAFIGTNRITVTRQNPDTTTTEMANVTLPSGYSFGLPTGIGDTPEAYGNTAAVNFNGGTTASFIGDGALVTGGSLVVNSTVFTIGTGNRTARALAITGASGRMKQYFVQGSAWVAR